MADESARNEAQPGKRRFSPVVWILGGVYVFGLGGLLAVHFPPVKAIVAVSAVVAAPIVLVAGMVGIIWLYLLWHELGHYVAGRAVGMTLHSLQVGPFEVTVTPKGRTLKRIAEWECMKGFCRMLPAEGSYTVRNLKVFYIGGLAANVLLLLVSFICARLVGAHLEPDWKQSTLAQSLMWWLTVFVAASVIKSLTATSPGSDMGRLRHLFDRRTAALYVHRASWDAAVKAKKRGRDWDISAVEALVSGASTPSERLIFNYLAFYAYWDRGDRELALKSSQLAAAECTNSELDKATRKLALLDFAFVQARVACNAADAVKALADSAEIDSEPLPHAEHRARAGIAMAEGDFARANSEANLACEALRNFGEVITPNIQEEIDWNKAMILEVEAAIQTATTPEP